MMSRMTTRLQRSPSVSMVRLIGQPDLPASFMPPHKITACILQPLCVGRAYRLQNASGFDSMEDAMKFLCLCHYDADQFAALGPADFEEIGRICAPHDAAFKASGHVDMVGSLGMPEQSRTLRAD